MSQEKVNEGSNQMFINSDLAKTFVHIQATERESYVNNSTYNPITLYMGTIMGRITGTDKLVPWRNDNVDGSQYPVGILGADVQVDSGDTIKALLVTKCRMAAEKVIAYQLSNQSVSTTLQLTISSLGGRRVKDILESIGIHLIYTTQMSFPDNS